MNIAEKTFRISPYTSFYSPTPLQRFYYKDDGVKIMNCCKFFFTPNILKEMGHQDISVLYGEKELIELIEFIKLCNCKKYCTLIIFAQMAY